MIRTRCTRLQVTGVAGQVYPGEPRYTILFVDCADVCEVD